MEIVYSKTISMKCEHCPLLVEHGDAAFHTASPIGDKLGLGWLMGVARHAIEGVSNWIKFNPIFKRRQEED